ncbi:MAG TPA: 4-(cytidine 5'-diphospho)-2-C-methyl-D-erythritol kinase [Thermoleophilaceae bacterium]
MLHERAYAKLNLVLHVGRPREDGLHPICSLMASIDLADELTATARESGEDSVEAPGVPGDNLAGRALAEFRSCVGGHLPPVALRIDKRIPVAAGLGGGSADAAAALRIANELAGGQLGAEELTRLAADLGSDVPSQLDPRHALVQGVGERVEPLALPALVAVLVPDPTGLSTAAVYGELDRMGATRDSLDPEPLRLLAAAGPAELAAELENDLQQAALSLRPELSARLDSLRAAGALGAAVSGSGPTCFGLFEDRRAAEEAAASIEGALVTELR